MMADAFDPNDPFDAMAEAGRVGVCELVSALLENPRFDGLDEAQTIECLMVGLLTGVVGCLLVVVQPASRDADAICAHAPEGRLQ